MVECPVPWCKFIVLAEEVIHSTHNLHGQIRFAYAAITINHNAYTVATAVASFPSRETKPSVEKIVEPRNAGFYFGNVKYFVVIHIISCFSVLCFSGFPITDDINPDSLQHRSPHIHVEIQNIRI